MKQSKLQKLFVWLQMTDLGEWPSSEMKQCGGLTGNYEQNAFFFFILGAVNTISFIES